MSYYFQPFTGKRRTIDTSVLKKYSGTKTVIVPRSKFEHWFILHQCEKNPQVQSWNYESVRIPYFNDQKKKNATYIPDIELLTVHKQRCVVEIKPYDHIFPPKLDMSTMNERELTYYDRMLETSLVNKSKFIAAHEWALQNNCTFYVYTEHGYISIKK